MWRTISDRPNTRILTCTRSLSHYLGNTVLRCQGYKGGRQPLPPLTIMFIPKMLN
jgi:hypothetical protein